MSSIRERRKASATSVLVQMSRPPLIGDTDTNLRMQEKLGTKEPILDAGPLAGALSNSTKILYVGGAFTIAAFATFLVALLSGSTSPDVSAILWVVGWALLLIGLGVLWVAAGVRAQREARLEDEMFKTEPSTVGLDYSVPRIVMVRCKYCGTLNAENASKCLSCGATL